MGPGRSAHHYEPVNLHSVGDEPPANNAEDKPPGVRSVDVANACLDPASLQTRSDILRAAATIHDRERSDPWPAQASRELADRLDAADRDTNARRIERINTAAKNAFTDLVGADWDRCGETTRNQWRNALSDLLAAEPDATGGQ